MINGVSGEGANDSWLLELNQALANTVDALHTPRFTSCLMRVLQVLTAFDCAVVVGYRPDKHPIYLFDSLLEHRELLFQRYLLDAYQKDPFLLSLAERQEQGVYGIDDVFCSGPERDDYLQGFYHQTGWKDEICIALTLDQNRWLVVYLGKLGDRSALSERFHHHECQRLSLFLSTLSSLCRQHWRGPFHLANAMVDSDVAARLRESVESFGKSRLTPREQQIVALLVQGMDSHEIAEYLAIGHGTVKNHRKRIYAQLQISSLGELFGLFLNHIVASSASSN
ncbi:LuxR family transcriptional regulator [Vreelandella venusta]|nr:LuxR family transcriptional regulator [Halomonas hydrothermalis]